MKLTFTHEPKAPSNIFAGVTVDKIELVAVTPVDPLDPQKVMRLFLAAPDMLDALKDALHSGQHACNCGDKCEGTCTFSILTSAIKKAES